MRSFLATVLCSSLLVIAGCSGEDHRSVTPEDSELVSGGSRKQSIEHVPWTVALLGQDQRPFCSGTVLADRWVLTSQHCLDGRKEGFKVAAGFEDLRTLAEWNRANSGLLGDTGPDLADGVLEDGQISTVDEIHRVAGYEASKSGKDIALLHLATSLELTGSRVRAATLTEDGAKSWAIPGETANVAGWGGGGGDASWWEVNATKVTFADPDGEVASSQVYGTIEGKVFSGDFGGPLTAPNAFLGEDPGTLIGITSAGLGETGVAFEGIDPYVSWIHATMSKTEW